MKTKYLLGALLPIVFAMTAGCSKLPTMVDNFHGTSYRLATQSQIANPAAGKNPQPIVGVSGTVGKKVMDRYETGFDRPAPKTESYSVTVGGMSKK